MKKIWRIINFQIEICKISKTMCFSELRKNSRLQRGQNCCQLFFLRVSSEILKKTFFLWRIWWKFIFDTSFYSRFVQQTFSRCVHLLIILELSTCEPPNRNLAEKMVLFSSQKYFFYTIIQGRLNPPLHPIFYPRRGTGQNWENSPVCTGVTQQLGELWV